MIYSLPSLVDSNKPFILKNRCPCFSMIITLVGNCCHRVMSCLIHRQEWKRTLDCRLISLIWFLRHSERVNDSHFEYSEKEKERERAAGGTCFFKLEKKWWKRSETLRVDYIDSPLILDLDLLIVPFDYLLIH